MNRAGALKREGREEEREQSEVGLKSSLRKYCLWSHDIPLNGYFHNIMPNASNAVTDGRATGRVFILVGGCSSSLPFSSSEYWNLNLFIPAGLTLTKVRATSHQYSSWVSQTYCITGKYHLKHPPTRRSSTGDFAASETQSEELRSGLCLLWWPQLKLRSLCCWAPSCRETCLCVS